MIMTQSMNINRNLNEMNRDIYRKDVHKYSKNSYFEMSVEGEVLQSYLSNPSTQPTLLSQRRIRFLFVRIKEDRNRKSAFLVTLEMKDFK